MAARDGECDGCTLCCVVFAIDALGKPPFQPCRHVGGAGCAIHGAPERPAVCGGFTCRHIDAHRHRTAERALVPHPRDAGAYVFQTPGQRVMVMCVDPLRPQAWRGSTLPDFLRAAIDSGFALAVHDRGYSFSIGARDHLEAVIAEDCVAAARAMGIAPNGLAEAGCATPT